MRDGAGEKTLQRPVCQCGPGAQTGIVPDGRPALYRVASSAAFFPPDAEQKLSIFPSSAQTAVRRRFNLFRAQKKHFSSVTPPLLFCSSTCCFGGAPETCRKHERGTQPKCQRAALGKIHKAAQRRGSNRNTQFLFMPHFVSHAGGTARPETEPLGGKTHFGTKCKYGGNKESGSGAAVSPADAEQMDLFWSHPCQASGEQCNPSTSPLPPLPDASLAALTLVSPSLSRQTNRGAGETAVSLPRLPDP